MPTNPFFQNYQGEQDLEEAIAIEIIQMAGMDVYYAPRTYLRPDVIYGEDPGSYFSQAYVIETYLMQPQGFAGTDIVSQFGIEIKQRMNFMISRRRFNELVGVYTGLAVPRPGDLIYLPLNKGIFEINYVKHQDPFYPLGRNWAYILECEMFTYSFEKINTGIVDLDYPYQAGRMFMWNAGVTSGTGEFRPGQPVFQVGVSGATLFEGTVVSWDPTLATPLLEISGFTGQPMPGYAIKGATTENFPSQPSYAVQLVNQSFKFQPASTQPGVPVGDNNAIDTDRFEDDAAPYDQQNPFTGSDI